MRLPANPSLGSGDAVVKEGCFVLQSKKRQRKMGDLTVCEQFLNEGDTGTKGENKSWETVTPVLA